MPSTAPPRHVIKPASREVCQLYPVDEIDFLAIYSRRLGLVINIICEGVDTNNFASVRCCVLQRLFDIARIYGGQLMEIPAKGSPKRSASAHTSMKPHPERSAPSVRVGTASPGAKGAPAAAMGTTLMRVEEERLEALRRKV